MSERFVGTAACVLVGAVMPAPRWAIGGEMTRYTGRKRCPLVFGHADVSLVVRRVSTTKLGRTELRLGRQRRRDLSSAPGQSEMIGVTYPPDDEET